MKSCRSQALRLIVLLLPALFFGRVSSGQWISETFTLSNGWNAIYVRETPWPAALDDQLTNLPIRAVHRSFRLYDVAQFTPSAQRQTSTSWAPLLSASPVPQCQRQCHL